MKRSEWLAASSVLAAVLVATPALAQPGLPPPGSPPDAQGGPATPAEQSDRLRRALDLRADQERALQAFVAAMRPKPGEIDALRAEAAREASLPTPQRLDATVTRLDRMRAEVLERIAATRAFYATLTPEQQHRFDQLPSPGR